MNGIILRPEGAPEARTSHWIIDPRHSCVEFVVSHLGIGLVKGRFRDVHGSVEIDEAVPERSTVLVDIEAGSIDTGQALRDMQLRGREFFHVQRYPRIGFRSLSVTPFGPRRFLLQGELSLRGRTEIVALEISSRGRAVNPDGCEREGFSGSSVIDRRNFGMIWNQEVPGGGHLLGNEVAIAVEAELVRSEPAPEVA